MLVQAVVVCRLVLVFRDELNLSNIAFHESMAHLAPFFAPDVMFV